MEFLAIKEFEGKHRSDFGTLTSSGVLASLTANTGKDLYLASAQFMIPDGSTAAGNTFTVALRINGVTIETINGDDNGGVRLPIKFNIFGVKVLAGQTIEINVTQYDFGTYSGSLVCWEEDTDESPQIPSI